MLNLTSFSAVLRSAAAAIGLVSVICLAGAAADVRAAHADWAESVALNVTPGKNEYGSSPTVLRWYGVDGAVEFENRTVCSTFVTQSLKKAYGWSDAAMKSRAGTSSPNAAGYHDLITAGKGFLRIKEPEAIMRGDLIAMKYMTCAGNSSSGHIVIALGPAIQRAANTEPLVPGTTQYEIRIADSSASEHFATNYPDTRADAMGNRLTSGAGVGWMRLYRNVSSGEIQGYTWSMQRSSTYYDASGCRIMAVGRLM